MTNPEVEPVGIPIGLVQRFPHVEADELLAGFVPPPHFAAVRFDTYLPDPGAPSQAFAVRELEKFAADINQSATAKTKRFRRSARRRSSADEASGVYLDGGFGVGKTHLLASLWFATATTEHRAYGTFVEYTNLVGALGFEATVAALSDYSLVCIDEFELDDPGDTVLMSSLLTRLAEGGVRLAATSNTLPDKLGEGRFAADDFLREIQGLASKFEIVRIDGDDYRHRGLPKAPPPLSAAAVERYATQHRGSSIDDFEELLTHLGQVHPSRYGAMLDGVQVACLQNVRQLTDQADALRLVVLVDRMYDRDIEIVASGIPLDELFQADMLAGGYRKKYRRAISRLAALAVER